MMRGWNAVDRKIHRCPTEAEANVTMSTPCDQIAGGGAGQVLSGFVAVLFGLRDDLAF